MAWFDYNETGYMNKTGWLSSEDGFLVSDNNSNGVIDDLSEMFGSTDASSQTENAGFEKLRAYDTNGDNVITDQDDNFQNLQIWRDTNSNGLTDTGELFSLADFGINEISLDYVVGDDTQNGNVIEATSTVKTDNGNMTIADISFNVDKILKIEGYNKQYNFDATIALLPKQRGYGKLNDFKHLASTNETFRNNLASISNSTSLSEMFEQMNDLLYLWADTTIDKNEKKEVYLRSGKLF